VDKIGRFQHIGGKNESLSGRLFTSVLNRSQIPRAGKILLLKVNARWNVQGSHIRIKESNDKMKYSIIQSLRINVEKCDLSLEKAESW
jgi:hypothetical protein